MSITEATLDSIVSEIESQEFDYIDTTDDVGIVLIDNDPIEDEDYLPVVTDKNPTVEMVVPKINKAEQARVIFAAQYGQPNVARKDIIKLFIEQVGLTKAGAATYYQKETSKLKATA